MILDDCVVVDCRHDLADRTVGPRLYAEGHLPGAHFLHQDDDLASPRGPGQGRHPLPEPDLLLAKLRALGLGPDTQLVAYDSHGGGLAGRLWWLARWLGHTKAAVLDGGLPAWQAEGFPLSREASAVKGAVSGPPAEPGQAAAVTVGQLMDNLQSRQWLVLDARSAERYRGEAEPVDPVAGHIPGSINRPFQQNLRPDGRFKPAEVLRAEFLALLDGREPGQIVHSCGSGVSACNNLVAMEYAGLAGSALYPGSWSEWCADPTRPVGRVG